jgi:hypothetical protein
MNRPHLPPRNISGTYLCCGSGSSVGIATGYEMDCPGIKSRWEGEIFRTCPDRPWGPPSLLYNGYWVFPGGKERPGHDADPSPTSSAVGYERVKLYMYSPYGPYGLYRASVPVQGWPLPLPFTFLKAQIAAKLVGDFENLIILVSGNSALLFVLYRCSLDGLHHRITLYVLKQQLLLRHNALSHRPSWGLYMNDTLISSCVQSIINHYPANVETILSS